MKRKLNDLIDKDAKSNKILKELSKQNEQLENRVKSDYVKLQQVQ